MPQRPAQQARQPSRRGFGFPGGGNVIDSLQLTQGGLFAPLVAAAAAGVRLAPQKVGVNSVQGGIGLRTDDCADRLDGREQQAAGKGLSTHQFAELVTYSKATALRI